MTPECPLCVVSGISGQAWKATGRFVTKRLSKPFIAAELRCLRAECRGRTWTSGLPEAVAAGQAVRAEQGIEPFGIDSPAADVDMRARIARLSVGSSDLHDVKQRASGEDR